MPNPQTPEIDRKLIEEAASAMKAFFDAQDAYRKKDYSNRLFDAMSFREDEARAVLAHLTTALEGGE